MTVVNPGGESRKDGNVNERGDLDGTSRDVLGPDVPTEPTPPIPHPENRDYPPVEHAPAQIAPDPVTGLVSIVAIVADEFGIPRSEVRRMIAMGTVQIDGADAGRVFELPYEDIKGKQIAVLDEIRTVTLAYRG